MPSQLVDPHLSYVHGACDVPLLGVTIGDLLDRVAGRLPQQEALVSCHQALRYSYAELRDECNHLARGLLALGVKKGDRVGIWATNYAEWVIAQFATPKVGAILVNVNPAYRVQELEYALRQSGCSTLIIGPTFKTSDYTALLRQVCPELDSSVPGQLHSARVPDLRTVIKFGDVRVRGTYHWDDVLVKGEVVSADELARVQREQQFDDPVNIQYTSGTTGFPKGATLSHHSIINNAIFNGRCMRFTEQDRLCIPVPFYHCFGTVFSNLTCLAYAATMIIPAPVFDVRATLQAVEQERCTALHGVPTMFIAELNHPDFGQFDLSSLRTGAMAGAPCPIEVMKQVVQKMHMTDVSIAYGMTETSPASFQTMADAPLEKRVSTVGQIHPHAECKIVDPTTGAVVARGQRGELLSRGYLVMLGYWNNERATREAIDAGGWMHTGDLGTMDADGYVSIVGRLTDMIIRGGENVYPREIEEFLYGHPKIKDVQVIGIPDEKYGEEIMAWVTLKPGEVATSDELRAFCGDQIAHYKIPRYWKFVESFPMTVTGKVQKFKMREMAIEEMDLATTASILTA